MTHQLFPRDYDGGAKAHLSVFAFQLLDVGVQVSDLASPGNATACGFGSTYGSVGFFNLAR